MANALYLPSFELRSENRYKRDYFKGKYGAIPFIREFKLFFGENDGER